MIKLSNRIQKVAPSPTLGITAKAGLMRKEGIDVVSFGAGEPDFDTPSHIKEAAVKAIQDGFTKYTSTSGIPELKEAVAGKFRRDNALVYAPSQIVISCGAKHSLYNTIQVLCSKGDEVIIFSPYWVSYIELMHLAEARPIIVKEMAILERAITRRTKALVLNSPCNPTGAVLSRKELEAIAALATRHGIFVLSDEVYEKFIYSGQNHYSIASIGKDIYDLTITVNAPSKTYSMTGWRIGYLGGPKDLAEAISRLQDHSTSCPSSISQKATLAALSGPGDCVEAMRSEFEARRNLMVDGLNKIAKASAALPLGAFYVWWNISQFGLSSIAFSERLLDEARVALVPGVAFGDDKFVRLSFAASRAQIEEGLRRISNWTKSLSK